jgi:hypothetical protein
MNSNNETIPVFVTSQECNLVVEQIQQQFGAAGLQTVCTFDLTTTLAVDEGCQCHMVVLLVYGKQGSPFSLSIYGQPDRTTVMLQYGDSNREMVTGVLAGVVSGNI